MSNGIGSCVLVAAKTSEALWGFRGCMPPTREVTETDRHLMDNMSSAGFIGAEWLAKLWRSARRLSAEKARAFLLVHDPEQLATGTQRSNGNV